MLDGIDYYPRKKKRQPKLKIWVLILSVFFIGLYGYQASENTTKKVNDNTLIVISKGKKPVEEKADSVIIKSNQAYQQTEIDRRVKSDRGLDELIQTFKQQ
ncbi:hypothetical protein [Candidatus Thioglobus sp.]|jgi:hypothetical protein|uniref:hypothetical protein n=1 Tax=Candidatus Thioglobus sp. TaxID=2026721 RepID=UPI001E02F3CD|nr:hypothetical protein [Candidatus Thioglobus sp.]MBT3277112.1 hypothetical protein [Candidatus Thioglobus sp.]MBT3446757.1 hypothetical protein [Candidatus Thioglobus sp.]MBT3744580.1 hypothetical protein [Candidatus Thioglobus sp.]MBT4001590.1 hypothetical protein [Candidatus Thioglobus sp.]MBT4181380.1 hypothetical protein [Candidatus Thioglobus sp.]